MYKKIISIITIAILILPISFALRNQPVSADTFDICKMNDVNKYLTKTAMDDFTKDLADTKNTNHNDLKVRIAFEKARAEYHDYVKCIFDVATIKILGSAAGIGISIKADDLPSLTKEILAELNRPDKACAVAENGILKYIIAQDGPGNMVPYMLETYEYYADFLRWLMVQQRIHPTIPKGYSGLAKILDNSNALQLIIENEIVDSIVALDTAFLALKEMRLSFVMHIRFQCMMKNLEAYRMMLGNLRKLVMSAPGLIIDASMHK